MYNTKKGIEARFIPFGMVAIDFVEVNAIVYVSNKMAMGFSGKRSKHDFYYSFASNEKRDAYIERYVANLKANIERKAEQKARVNKPHTFEIGEVAVNSWGYDQTQVDFYQIVNKTAHTVQLRQIASAVVKGSEGFMSCEVVAIPNKFISDEIITKKATADNHISMSCGYCGKWDGTPRYKSWYA